LSARHYGTLLLKGSAVVLRVTEPGPGSISRRLGRGPSMLAIPPPLRSLMHTILLLTS
jgi:hypothetical protein